MEKPIDNFYLKQTEPNKSCLLALRDIILNHDNGITAEWKYGMPFFCFKGKMFCYLWIHKTQQQPYIGMVEGKHFLQSFLIQEKRSRMKIMMIDANEDLPIETIQTILKQAIDLYKNGIVKLKE